MIAIYPATIGSRKTVCPTTPIHISLPDRHFTIVMDALGIIADKTGAMEIDKFLAIAEPWLRAHRDKPAIEIVSRESHAYVNSATVIDLPLRAGYVHMLIEKLIQLLRSANKAGATHVGWH